MWKIRIGNIEYISLIDTQISAVPIVVGAKTIAVPEWSAYNTQQNPGAQK
jgi:hypothetical protein